MRWARRSAIPLALLVVLGEAASADEADPASPTSIPQALPGAPPLPAPLRRRLEAALTARGPDYEPRTRQRAPDGSPLYTNRLLLEPSPYLQQHAHNPVNWYPWGDEAFAEAKRSNRPVLVSIGYSTCHWCHVMEEESFDDPAVASYLNEHFVAVKVDREIRPDVDSIYMTVARALNGSGGWPLNVWVTPDRQPFFAGTYFPPDDRGGRPGFARLLRSLKEIYEREPERIVETARLLSERVRAELRGPIATSTRLPRAEVLERAAQLYAQRVDRVWGGIGVRQKFPSRVPIRFLLGYHQRTGDPEALQLASLTLEKMASGGIHDQIGGGFHRYATDPRWLVPHFEKMLYDNALLAVAYLEAWQVTERADFALVARTALDYLLREMRLPDGGFASATDADSPNEEGELEEGSFFTWTPNEVREVLPPDQAAMAILYYGVEDEGPVEGRSVLHAWRTPGQVAAELGLEPEVVERGLVDARRRLHAVRSTRTPPHRDEKVLVAWNGLVISALARGGFAMDEPSWIDAASRAAEHLLDHVGEGDRLYRVLQGGKASGPAFLEDYAFLVAGLLDLYEARPDPRWLRRAIGLQRSLEASYADLEGGGYFRTASTAEPLLAREKPAVDSALPSGNSVAAQNLLRLFVLTGHDAYLERAGLLLSGFADSLDRDPTRHAELLLAVDHQLAATREIAVVAPGSGGDLTAMLAPLRRTHLPHRALVVVREGDELSAHAEVVPWIAGKVARQGRVTAYVCENRVCTLPTTDPEVFAGQIRVARPLRP
jgi:uncharacterized protein YyaL (SSP411 family)